jgi:DnaT DNA-binding domain
MSALPLFDMDLGGQLEGPPKIDSRLPSTPIAAELHAHFAEDGSIADAIKLVERIERANSHMRSARRSHRSLGARGTRLEPGWQPSHEEILFARSRRMPPAMIEAEIEKFRNYWVAKSGPSATKRDWSATWRNWIINAMERANGYPGIGRPQQGNIIQAADNLVNAIRAFDAGLDRADGIRGRAGTAPPRLLSQG